MKVSIIIPTLNEEKYLPKLIESIKSQDFHDYEVIVGDAHSTDHTREIAKKYGAKVVDGGMPAVGRNNGAKAAKGEYLFFFDADVKLPKHFLKNAVHEMERRKIDLATCEIVPISNLSLDKVLHDLTNLFIKINQFIDPHAPGFCILVKKDLFNKAGRFNEALKIAEDHAFVRKAAKIKPLRVLNSVKILVSIRRLSKEGRLVLAGKYIKVDLHRIFIGEVKHDLVEYEFANFGKNKDQRKLLAIEKKLIKIERDYKKMSKSIRSGEMAKDKVKKLKKELENTRDSLIATLKIRNQKK